jgi:hypothetical protein
MHARSVDPAGAQGEFRVRDATGSVDELSAEAVGLLQIDPRFADGPDSWSSLADPGDGWEADAVAAVGRGAATGLIVVADAQVVMTWASFGADSNMITLASSSDELGTLLSRVGKYPHHVSDVRPGVRHVVPPEGSFAAELVPVVGHRTVALAVRLFIGVGTPPMACLVAPVPWMHRQVWERACQQPVVLIDVAGKETAFRR